MEVRTWSDLLQLLVLLVVGLLGVPLTQALKNAFGWKDKAALALTAVIAFVVASLEIYLSGMISFVDLGPQDIPGLFGLVFTTATVYYKLLSGSEGFFGRGMVLREKPLTLERDNL
jgi:CHASE2 domain-containing sensor protein